MQAHIHVPPPAPAPAPAPGTYVPNEVPPLNIPLGPGMLPDIIEPDVPEPTLPIREPGVANPLQAVA